MDRGAWGATVQGLQNVRNVWAPNNASASQVQGQYSPDCETWGIVEKQEGSKKMSWHFYNSHKGSVLKERKKEKIEEISMNF